MTSICVWKYVLKIKKSRDHKTESVAHLIVHDVSVLSRVCVCVCVCVVCGVCVCVCEREREREMHNTQVNFLTVQCLQLLILSTLVCFSAYSVTVSCCP